MTATAHYGAIQITPHDLAQLEQGLLGERQWLLLYQQRRVWMLGTASFALLALFLLALLILRFIDSLRIRSDFLTAISIFSIAWLWLLRRAPYSWWQVNRDLRAGEAAVLDGQVERYSHQSFGFVRLARYSSKKSSVL